MNLTISGHHLEVTPALRGYVTSKLERISRHFDQVVDIKVLLTVSPPKAEPHVAFVSAAPVMIPPKAPPGSTVVPTGPGTPGIAVTVRNTGNRYAMMAGSTWTIDGTGADGKSVHLVLKEEDLDRLIGAGYLAPLGGERTFQIPTDAPFANKPIKVSFS